MNWQLCIHEQRLESSSCVNFAEFTSVSSLNLVILWGRERMADFSCHALVCLFLHNNGIRRFAHYSGGVCGGEKRRTALCNVAASGRSHLQWTCNMRGTRPCSECEVAMWMRKTCLCLPIVCTGTRKHTLCLSMPSLALIPVFFITSKISSIILSPSLPIFSSFFLFFLPLIFFCLHILP